MFVDEPNQDGRSTSLTGNPDLSSSPELVAVASADYQRRENFLRGCLW